MQARWTILCNWWSGRLVASITMVLWFVTVTALIVINVVCAIIVGVGWMGIGFGFWCGLLVNHRCRCLGRGFGGMMCWYTPYLIGYYYCYYYSLMCYIAWFCQVWSWRWTPPHIYRATHYSIFAVFITITYLSILIRHCTPWRLHRNPASPLIWPTLAIISAVLSKCTLSHYFHKQSC